MAIINVAKEMVP